MDGSHAFRQQLSFRLPNSCRKRLQLAIDIGNADIVEVNQSQSSHGRPCQSFRHITSDSAESENRDVGTEQRSNLFVTDQTYKTIPATMNSIGCRGKIGASRSIAESFGGFPRFDASLPWQRRLDFRDRGTSFRVACVRMAARVF